MSDQCHAEHQFYLVIHDVSTHLVGGESFAIKWECKMPWVLIFLFHLKSPDCHAVMLDIYGNCH